MDLPRRVISFQRTPGAIPSPRNGKSSTRYGAGLSVLVLANPWRPLQKLSVPLYVGGDPSLVVSRLVRSRQRSCPGRRS